MIHNLPSKTPKGQPGLFDDKPNAFDRLKNTSPSHELHNIRSMILISKLRAVHDSLELRNLIKRRFRELSQITPDEEYSGLLFEVRKYILFQECTRLLDYMANGDLIRQIKLSYSLSRQNLDKQAFLNCVSEAAELTDELPKAQNKHSHGSHLGFYMKVAALAARFQIFRIKAELIDSGKPLGIAEFMGLFTNAVFTIKPMLPHSDKTESLAVLKSLEEYLKSHKLGNIADEKFSFDILMLPFCNRSFV
ncbi:hypothetical protein FJZ26_00525 [Candidatus Parvarchaeota archaeon]|nr:hypothetical protein [Candidatus Parvarchaeota archaeon]